MTSGIAEKPLIFYARIAGFSILLSVAAGIVANVLIAGGLMVPEETAITAADITVNELVLRFGIFSFLILLVLDLVVAWALYVLLKQVNKNLALLAAWFRLVYIAMFGAALFNFLNILQLLGDDASVSDIEPNQIGLEVMMHINAINNAWTIALVFFGGHLLILGYLLFKSGFVPKVLGILMLFAGLGYFIDNVAVVLLSDYVDLMAIFSLIIFVLSMIAELAFAIWLLAKGKKIPETSNLQK